MKVAAKNCIQHLFFTLSCCTKFVTIMFTRSAPRIILHLLQMHIFKHHTAVRLVTTHAKYQKTALEMFKSTGFDCAFFLI